MGHRLPTPQTRGSPGTSTTLVSPRASASTHGCVSDHKENHSQRRQVKCSRKYLVRRTYVTLQTPRHSQSLVCRPHSHRPHLLRHRARAIVRFTVWSGRTLRRSDRRPPRDAAGELVRSAFPFPRRAICGLKNRTYCQRAEKEKRGDFHSSIKTANRKSK